MKRLTLLLAFAMLCLGVPAQTAMTLRTDRPGAAVQPTMYGIFFEDINFAADGGLYAELVKNRSFEFPQSLMGWKAFGKVEVRDDGPFERAPHYVRLSHPGHHEKQTGLQNEGYFGIPFHGGEALRLSLWGRVPEGGTAAVKVMLVQESTAPAAEGQALAETVVSIDSETWRKYQAVISVPEGADGQGQLRLLLDSKDVPVDLEHISLFPEKTFNNDDNGLRADLAQLLADLKPGIFRFPGGCIVEGTDLDTRYNWKNSVGPVENRPLNENRWNYTFAHRLFPDYFQSYGLGFYEFFRLAEEIGAEPLPVISVGLACQFQNHSDDAHVPVSELQPYIQDALDLIEFANGDTATTWGKVRAEMGHPAPFGLKFLAIGNEQWGPEYPQRLEPFVKAVRKAYPDIKIVGSAGPSADGEQFDYLWPEMRRLGADLVDEHYYRDEQWFASQASRYDSYPRKGPKVFAGEYACHVKGSHGNNFLAALMEAALMTGLERNADVVHMATYAPLFAHTEGWQWRPDMIWYDNLSSAPTTSYYVQQLFSTNKGTNVLPLCDAEGRPFTGQDGLYASAVLDAATGEYIVKVVNINDSPRQIAIDFAGLKKKEGINAVSTVSLHSDDLSADNTPSQAARVTPASSSARLGNVRSYTADIPAHTVQIMKFNK